MISLRVSGIEQILGWAEPPDPSLRREALRFASHILIGRLQSRFGKVVADERGNPSQIAPLSPTTLKMAEGRAKKEVAGEFYQSASTRKKKGVLVAVYKRRTVRVRRTGESLPLVDTGQLRASIVSGPYHEEFLVTSDEMVVGTRLPYARILHDGGTITVTREMQVALGMQTGVWFNVGTVLRIPPRPFLNPLQREVEDAARAYAEYIAKRKVEPRVI